LPTPPAAAPPAEPQFKLSGVMMDSRGGTAILNGQPVRLGESLDGAKVVTINQHWVELQLGDRRIRVGM
jgi:hypothetical protein